MIGTPNEPSGTNSEPQGDTTGEDWGVPGSSMDGHLKPILTRIKDIGSGVPSAHELNGQQQGTGSTGLKSVCVLGVEGEGSALLSIADGMRTTKEPLHIIQVHRDAI